MAWDETTRKYELRNARIIATVHGGGAMIERGDFVYEEGRMPAQYNDDGKGRPPALEPFYEFSVLDAPQPDATESVEARIVIDGEGEAGRLEIRGNGYIGYDENGFVTGHFERPPEMLLDHGVKLGGPKMEGKPELTREEWLAHMEVTRPRTSAEYDRAIRARDWLGTYDEDDDDD